LLTAVAAAVSAGSQPELPGFLNSLAGPLGHYGLWAIALLVLVEDFGIPVPGETVLIAGAIYAGSGRLNVVAVGLVGFAAAVIGDNIGYAIGRFGGRALVERWGRYVFITPERLDKAEVFFEKHGGKIITIARFIEGLRQANGLIAGITHMHWLKFVAFNALGAALWVGTWVSVGYFAGQHIATIYSDITNYSLYAVIAAVVLIAAWVFLRLRRRRRERAALAAMQAESREARPAGVQAQDAEPREASRPAAQAQAQAQEEEPGGEPAPPEARAEDTGPEDTGAPGEVTTAAAQDPEPLAAGQAQDSAPGQVKPAGAPDNQQAEPGLGNQAPGENDQAGPRNGQAEVRAQDSDRS
jgi:membrane protein DedA with SNARE-associated domain